MENLTEAPLIAKKGTFPATIVKVINDFQIVIDKGKEDRIRQGQRVLLYNLSEDEIIDPNTGESLGYLEIVKGTGRVIDIQEKMSIIESEKVIKPDFYSSIFVRNNENFINSLKNVLTDSENGRIQQLIDGVKVRIPFDNPQVGDKVKPI